LVVEKELYVINYNNILRKIIQDKLIIDIVADSNKNTVYSGICLVANNEILLFLNFNEETGEFDGFTILKNKDFEAYRIWESEDYAYLINDNSEEELREINPKNFKDLKTSFHCLKNELIAVFTYHDPESYYVGRITSINENTIELEKLNRDSIWVGKELIAYKEISCIGFRTKYERKLNKNIITNDSN